MLKNLKSLRLASKLSQQQLADVIGVSQQSVNKYENHSVENITRHEADKVSTDQTIAYILEVIEKSKENAPSFLMVLTAVGPSYRRKDGVFVVPINLLKP
mgnify:CR=1 FL=1